MSGRPPIKVYRRVADIPLTRRHELIRTATLLMNHADSYLANLQYKERCYVRLWIMRLAKEAGWLTR